MDNIFQSHVHFHHPMIIKTLVHFLLPLSLLFSLLFTISSIASILSGVYANYLHHCLPTTALILHLFDRNCMFLVCNGIIVILTKNVKLNTSGGEMTEMPPRVLVLKEESVIYVEETPSTVPDILLRAEEDQKNEEECYYCADLERGAEELRTCLALENGDWEDDDDDDDDDMLSEEEEEINDVSTEELNKKFEEFIRRMKEEIRIQAMNTML